MADQAHLQNQANLLDVARRPFLEIATDISGALVYLDAGAAELVHVSLGAQFLYGLGAAHVCQLEHAAAEDAVLPCLTGKSVSTLVIAITRLLTEAHPQILRAVLAHPYVTRVVVLSSVSEHAHACQSAIELGVEAFQEYGQMLQQDVSDMREANAAMGSGPGPAPPAPAQHFSVTVKGMQMNICALDAGTFVLPAASAAATHARSGGVAAGFGGPEPRSSAGGMDEGGASSDGLSLLANELAGVVAQLGAHLEAFSLGPVSHQLAQELVNLPLPTPHEAPGRPAPVLGVVLVDRSLDTLTPCLHQDHLLDQMLALLPRGGDRQEAKPKRGPRHASWRPLDLRVDVPGVGPLHSPAVTATPASSAQPAGESLFGAELLNPADKVASTRLEQLLHKKGKDAATLVRKWLKQALATEKLQPSTRSKAGTVTAGELAGLAGDLAAQPGAALRNRGVAALGHASAGCLSGAGPARWEAAGALERTLCGLMCQGAAAGGDGAAGGGVAGVLRDALSTAQGQAQATLTVSDVLQLLPLVYSLAPDAAAASGAEPGSSGPLSPGEEEELKAAVATAVEVDLQEQGTASSVLQELMPDLAPLLQQGGDRGISTRVDTLFSRLHYIAQARSRLTDLTRVTVADLFSEGPGTVAPLLRQLARRAVGGEPLPDLVQATSASLTGMLSKGLGRLVPSGFLGAVAGAVAGEGRRAARPADCQLLLVFVVGGVSPVELREVRAELEAASAAGTGPHVLLGGTSLLSPADVARQLLAAA